MPEKKSAKYWETEKPEVETLGVNQFRWYKENGKLQMYRVKESAPNGVTKGCTMELDQMSVEELEELKDILTSAIDFEIAQREGEEEEPKPKKKSAKKTTTATTTETKKKKRKSA